MNASEGALAVSLYILRRSLQRQAQLLVCMRPRAWNDSSCSCLHNIDMLLVSCDDVSDRSVVHCHPSKAVNSFQIARLYQHLKENGCIVR